MVYHSGVADGSATPDPRILIVDDNPSIHEDFRKILAPAHPPADALRELERALFGEDSRALRSAFQLDSAFQGQEALEKIDQARAAGCPYALTFIDVRMPPGWNGVDTTARILQVDADLQIVLCTAFSDYGWEDIVNALGETDRVLILKKPFNTIEVRQLAHTLSAKWRLERASKRRMADLEQRVATRTRDLQDATAQLRHEMDQRVRAERRLREAQRLEALGRLAAGLGHEINNPLSFIVASVEAIDSELAGLEGVLDPALRADLDELLEAALIGADRIAQIIRNIKLFARPSNAPAELVDASAALALCARMVECELDAGVRIELDTAPVPPVIGRRVEIEQVLINLLKNAAHALAETPPSQPQLIARSRCDDDQHVVIEIQDNGPGMDADVLGRIFDPFFSTKPAERGSGLGLAICQSIIKGLGGTITVRSTRGQGTCVTVRLPPAPEGPRPGAARPVRQPRKAPGESVRGRVLVIDDEPFVLRVIERALRTHEVVTMTSGRDALARCMSETFDLILCDIIMPDLSGRDLYQLLAQAQPGAEDRIVFITGGQQLEEVKAFLASVPNDRIEKPFETAALQDKVAQAIHARRGEAATEP